MPDVGRLAGALIAFAMTPYGLTTLAALLIACIGFGFSAKRRAEIDAAMGKGDSRKPLRLLDLSHGDVRSALRERRLVAPERLWSYDETYLERFAQLTLHARVREEPSALHLYVRTVLHRFDLVFAIGLGTFVYLANLAIADALVATHPLWARAAWIAACMGLLYGVADVAEDLKLASILARAVIPDSELAGVIDPAEAAAANVLTRVKLVTIVLSALGALVFAALSIAAAIAIRPPSHPAREAVTVRAG
jgi:hypothetical protein